MLLVIGDMSDVWQELQRDMHKRQLLIDEELEQSVEQVKANAATGAGLYDRLDRALMSSIIQKAHGLICQHMGVSSI